MEEKKLRRSKDKWIAGVCGGVAEYVGLDPLIVRIVWIVATLFTGVPILIYVALLFIMPAPDEMGAAPGGGAGTS